MIAVFYVPCSPLGSVQRMYQHLHPFLEDEAKEWIKGEITRMRMCNEGIECQIPLPCDTTYDNSDIDFREVLKQYRVLDKFDENTLYSF